MPETEQSTWNGYQIIGDTLNKEVKPRYKRIDRWTASLHFFQHYALRDHINLSSLSDVPNPYLSVPTSEFPIDTLLPRPADHQTLLNNFTILISRVVVFELVYFENTFGTTVNHHI